MRYYGTFVAMIVSSVIFVGCGANTAAATSAAESSSPNNNTEVVAPASPERVKESKAQSVDERLSTPKQTENNTFTDIDNLSITDFKTDGAVDIDKFVEALGYKIYDDPDGTYWYIFRNADTTYSISVYTDGINCFLNQADGAIGYGIYGEMNSPDLTIPTKVGNETFKSSQTWLDDAEYLYRYLTKTPASSFKPEDLNIKSRRGVTCFNNPAILDDNGVILEQPTGVDQDRSWYIK